MTSDNPAVQHVQAFPTGAGKWRISTGGANFPRQRRDGRELFYMDKNSGEKLVAVSVKRDMSTFEADVPHEPFVVLNWAQGLKK